MLTAPFPASPTRPPKYGFYFQRNLKFVAFHNFHAAYAAKAFLDEVIQDRPVSWLDDNTIEVGNLRIRGEGYQDMDAIMDYKPTKEEQQWVLPSPYPNYAAYINDIQVEAPPKAPTPTPVKKERKKPKRKATPDGLTTVAALADELGITPNKARTLLRKAKEPKPAHGWSYPPEELNRIRAILSSSSKK